MIYRKYDVLVVPFPFSDRLQQKVRPVLVVSGDEFNQSANHYVTAMITTAKKTSWPLDTPIHDIRSAGLPKSSYLRMKFFTADRRMVMKKIGRLSQDDRDSVHSQLQRLLH